MQTTLRGEANAGEGSTSRQNGGGGSGGSGAPTAGLDNGGAAAAFDLSADSMVSASSTSNGNGNSGGGGGVADLQADDATTTTTTTRTPSAVRNGKAPATSADDDDSSDFSEEDDDDDDDFRPIFEDSMIDKKEFVRLALQSLRDLGFKAAAHALEKESGVKLEHPSITTFRTAVLSGEWKNADRLLMEGLRHAAARRLRHSSSLLSSSAAAAAIAGLAGASGSGSGSSSSVNVNCVLRDPESQSLESIKFALQQQRFLELLEAGHNKKALSVLRDRLTPLNYGSERLHQLSSLMMCESPEQLRVRARWDGAKGQSRRDLLQEIESAVLPTVMIPSRRLPQLLEQAQMLQKQMDPYYNLDSRTEHLSLYVDVQSDRSGFPSWPTNVMFSHRSEVWTLDFSPDGGKLASGGKDQTVIVYAVSTSLVEKICHYGPFSAGGVSCVKWSPDSRWILCAAEEVVYLIDTADGTHKSFREHIYRISALAWLPDGSGFVTGSMDGKILFWTLSGSVRVKWEIAPYRVLGLDVSADGRRMVVISYRVEPPNQPHSSTPSSVSYSDSPSPSSTTMGHHDDGGRAGLSALMRAGQERNRIYFYDLETYSVLGLAGATEEMTCVSISKDSRFVLLNKRPNETQVWDIELAEVVQVYQGHTIFKNMIGACFGGAEKNNFIVTGSEDAKIYVYHRASGRTLERLSHGVGCVNSVAWHPTNKAMFASASDDSSVCVWQPGQRRRGASGSGLNGRMGGGGSGGNQHNGNLGSSSAQNGNGFRRASSGASLLMGGGSGGAGASGSRGDRSDSRRKSEGASSNPAGLLGGSGSGGNGGAGPSGSGSGGARGNGEHGSGDGSESGMMMGGPIPFPWAVSPLHPGDSAEDVSMLDEGMYDDPL
ncbi:unnamed protein product [Tilletia laevis]|uniref:CTLH domain-containing protein n=2 Tax=Tilletia TaxID=13289 RepID=A0A177V7C3_9BASI|nr:hypothetical protein CF336_g3001 [Tilletia laevis]KAE8256577.1 hypothetical protein A4X03_0g5266 [Tilletia caries]KAE8202061.1 hypothetical protein CF335_g3558 [Tilletia laevis]CAD6888012.1 unnamed protein product [Tilletia caries]CAD6899735.1 unnamed protein product [Tilletia laevis]